MVSYSCEKCGKNFDRKCNYEKHIKRTKPCTLIKSEQIKICNQSNQSNQNDKLYKCQSCDKFFSRKDSLNRHQKTSCERNILPKPATTPAVRVIMSSHTPKHENKPLVGITMDQIKELVESKVNDIKNQIMNHPTITNNLQVVCVGSKDNYLDMLTEKWGNFDRALEYIKDCALSNLTGDCKLLGKIYFDPSQQICERPIRFHDRRFQKLSYVNESNETVIDPKGSQLGKKLANNLQNTYLKGVNFLMQKKEDFKTSLDEYDLQMWNRHIFELSDEQYQRKIITNLEIAP